MAWWFRMPLAALTVLVICCCIFSCTTDTSLEMPVANRGVLDVSQWQFDSNGPIYLDGEYEFYWQSLLNPTDFSTNRKLPSPVFISVPSVWNDINIDSLALQGTGYATYRLLITNIFTEKQLSLHIKDMATAFRLFVNGNEIVQQGQVSSVPEFAKPKFKPGIFDLKTTDADLEIIIQVSNFHHRKGGIWEQISLGPQQQIVQNWGNRLAFDLFIIGTLAIMGLYHLILYLLNARSFPLLGFSLFCLVISVRMLCVEERWLIYFLEDVNWELFIKLEYLSGYLTVPTFAIFLYWMFKPEFNTYALYTVLLISGITASLVILTPAAVFTNTFPFYAVFIVMCCCYATYILIRGRARQPVDAILFLSGFLVIFATTIIDLLDIAGWLQTGHYIGLGLLIFILMQAGTIAFRHSRTFRIIRDQHQIMGEMNVKYKQEINDRIKAEDEKQQLAAKLARSERMEALGLLAGGVAHDLNNVLSGIVSYPDLILMDLQPETTLYRRMEVIRDSGEKAAAIVEDLLTLTRRGVMRPEIINLNQLIIEHMRSAEIINIKKHHPNLQIIVETDPLLLNISGSPIHIKKSLLNLLTNAAEAQPNGGDVIVSTQNVYLEKRDQDYNEMPEGDYARLRVVDHGIGIAQEDLEHIFEPFYTKKVMGTSGTGLGMTVVWGTVHDHAGHIDVNSREGRGTIFDLYFPATRDQIDSRSSYPLPLQEYMGRGEKILVIDDINEQREIASNILRRLNYEPVSVPSGEAAVEFLRDHTVDCLILDMVMEPGIGGLETYQQIIDLRPGTPAVIASGFSETEEVRIAQELGAGEYLRKPYTIEKLGIAIQNQLVK